MGSDSSVMHTDLIASEAKMIISQRHPKPIIKKSKFANVAHCFFFPIISNMEKNAFLLSRWGESNAVIFLEKLFLCLGCILFYSGK